MYRGVFNIEAPESKQRCQEVASGAHAPYLLWTLKVTYRVTMLVAANMSMYKMASYVIDQLSPHCKLSAYII